ncbi:hypothetical protein I580_01044 [Enterococcus caccae ATCC BAA-1240]|uniref:Uncharacterized protein n=1 Tax=Enterococcus caccae ATCC BAA-1240 TaxID=1158612 RepID=R3TST0_9ENTE|nr:hypothetical protein UC7_02267 [Enterococcus caccae ATCC BAA-1240]EOT68661.1 hypothetical protein I580_01044 [Enterococcus caccae ATCC BAA-1240]
MMIIFTLALLMVPHFLKEMSRSVSYMYQLLFVIIRKSKIDDWTSALKWILLCYWDNELKLEIV